MGKPDRNFLSYAGKRPLGQVRLGDLAPPTHDDFGNPIRWSDTLKVTNCADGEIHVGIVVGGTEDCIDINNKTERVIIYAKRLEPRGKFVITYKGESRDCEIHCPCVVGHGREVDIDLGGISDQSDNTTGRLRLNLRHEKGEPITVRTLNAVRPVFLNAHEQEYRSVFGLRGFWRSIFAKLVALLKKLGVPV